MEANKSVREQIEAAHELERTGRLSEAAAIYQKLFDKDPSDQQVIGRLLVMYRKLKDYRKELAVLNDALAAQELRRKAMRDKWIQSHPKAASAGRSMLRQLQKGSNALTGLGGDAIVERWMKRKNLVTKRITGKKGKEHAKPKNGKKADAGHKKARILQLRQNGDKEKQLQREEAAAARQKASRERIEAAARKKKEEQERKAAEVSRRKKEQEKKKAEVALQKAAAERKKTEAKHPSLFVIILRYLVSLEEIDAVMKQHMAYLHKHYDKGDFLVSGRQVPRTGGVILARAKNRTALEKTIKQDPFVKERLASADIIEFIASQFGKGLQGWLRKAGGKQSQK
jgi:uncharacterized protein YciI